MVEFVARERAKGHRLITLAHRTELIEQISQTLDEAQIDHGVVKANHPRHRPALPVQVASVPTLYRRLHKAPRADILVFDVCHRTMAGSYLKIIEAYPNAKLLGFTATPWRQDNKGLGNVYQSIVVAANAPQLIEWGYLVNPSVYAPTRVDLSKVKVSNFGDHDERSMARVMNTQALCGDVVEHWHRIGGGQRTLVFACNVAHSKALCERFVAAGVSAEHVDGSTPSEMRRAIFSRLRRGETLVVCNVNIATEGLDVPELGNVVLAMGTKSITRYLQACGRVMQPAPDKQKACIIDHAGNVHRHGLPSADRDYTLSDRMPGEEPELRECPQCSAVVQQDATVCSECGYVFPSPKDTPVDAMPTDMSPEQPTELVLVNSQDRDTKTATNGDTSTANADIEALDWEIRTYAKQLERRGHNTPRPLRVTAPSPFADLPCPHCGAPTRERRDAARYGHFGVLVMCAARCRSPWFRTDSDGVLNATPQQQRDEKERFERLARQKGKNPGWAQWMLQLMIREARKNVQIQQSKEAL